MRTFEDMESPKTFLPGVKAQHIIISTACREGRGDDGAASAAICRMETEIKTLLGNWPQEKGATFHLVLTVDRAGRGDGSAPEPAPKLAPTCCYRGCGQAADDTFTHDDRTHACLDHVELLRPWL